MLLSTGERISCALCAMAINDLGHRAISLTGSQAGIVTDTSHTKARILDVRADRITRGAGRGPDRARRRLSGRVDQPRRDHARPRRLGHHRGRGGRRDRRRGVRDLHRRRRRVQRRPADRPRRPQAAAGQLRGDARDGGLGRQGAAAALGRVRAHPRRADPLPIKLRSRPRYRCPRRRRDHGTPAHHRRHPLDRRGADHAARRARPAGRGRVDLHARSPRPTATSTRSSRTSRSPRAATPRCRSRSAPRTCAPPSRRWPRCRPTWASPASRPTARSARSRSSAPGMRSHPGVAAKVFQTLADEGINIEMISTSPIKISCIIRAGRRAPGGARAALRVRAGRGRDRARAGPAMTRVAVVGATGAVGRVMLELLRERAFPADEIVPVRLGALGRAEIDGRTVQAARRRRRSERLRHRAVLRRRRHLPRVGAAVRRRRRRRDRQLVGLPPRSVGPARRLRGQPARAAPTTAA